MSVLAFESYARKLDQLTQRVISNGSVSGSEDDIQAALNSGPSQALRSAVDSAILRKHGAFFTGHLLANQAIDGSVSAFSTNDIIADPTCGAGDLLIRCAQSLPMDEDLHSTLMMWSRQLIGYDLHDEFVRVSKARLILTALTRGVLPRPDQEIPLLGYFPRIKVGNYREHLEEIASASYLFVNPPYNTATVERNHGWTTGTVSAAAVFMDDITATVAPGTRIVAILPDVLRSGRRYELWRKLMASRGEIESVEVVGVFDRWTDVDVFVLRMVVGPGYNECPVDWSQSTMQNSGSQIVGDLFNVHVGSVVPHRHPELGPVFPYLHARTAPPWRVLTLIAEQRAYQGTVFQPPFVVVRRTSTPHDTHRAIGTMVLMNEKVAIENHLMVLVPKNGSIDNCYQLMDSLRRKETDDWFNRRIRCRHLTTAALNELPLCF